MKYLYSVDIKCPGCDLTNKVDYKKPKPLTPSVVKYKCEYCESIIVSQVKYKTASTVTTCSTVLVESKNLKDAKAEVGEAK